MKRATLPLLLSALALGCAASATAPKGALQADASRFAVGGQAADDPNGAFAGDLGWCSLTPGTLTASMPYRVWRLAGPGCGSAFIDLASRDGDDLALLALRRTQDGRAVVVAANDDCDEGTLNACLTVEVPAGEALYLVATTYDYAAYGTPTAASFNLLASCTNEAGECEAPADITACGSRGLPPCGVGEYCDWSTDDTADACGATDHAGVCRPIPGFCTKEYLPVCGCDGNTYGNGCMAHAAGTDIAAAGECAEDRPPPDPDLGKQGPGETCGGIAALECKTGLACDYSAHTSCYPDQAGVCISEVEVLCAAQYAPVCGCDGVTYSNDCVRIGARAARAHAGPC